jgi:hypothetical protein
MCSRLHVAVTSFAIDYRHLSGLCTNHGQPRSNRREDSSESYRLADRQSVDLGSGARRRTMCVGVWLEAAPVVVIPLRVSRRHENALRARKWPIYQLCLDRAPRNHGDTGPDVSRAEFVWCMTALDCGYSADETAKQLMQVSSKARENGERYANLTASNAAAAVQRKGQGLGKG